MIDETLLLIQDECSDAFDYYIEQLSYATTLDDIVSINMWLTDRLQQIWKESI